MGKVVAPDSSSSTFDRNRNSFFASAPSNHHILQSPRSLRSRSQALYKHTHGSNWLRELSLPTMFFLYNLERQVTLHPSYFGRNMHELVTGKLLKDVEGTCTGRYFIITIMDTFNISEGRILPGSGLAEFTVGYRAVVWRPFKGETVRT